MRGTDTDRPSDQYIDILIWFLFCLNLYLLNYILSFYRSDNQIIAAGSAEGEVAIVNHQTGKIVANFSSKKRQSNSINEDEEENGNSSIESLIFSTPETNQLLTADVDGNFMGMIILTLYKIMVDFSSFIWGLLLNFEIDDKFQILHVTKFYFYKKHWSPFI